MIKQIHFIWWQGWNKLPHKYEIHIKNWKKHNPDYKIYYWDEQKIIDLFNKKSIKPNLLDDFDLMIQKIDFSKYVILYYYGGIYSDVDINCNNSIDNFISKDKFTVCKMKPFNNINYDLINNGFIYSPKNDVIIKKIINQCIKHNNYILGHYIISELQTLLVTGPLMMSHLLYKEDIHILDNNIIYECNLEEYNKCYNKGLLGTHIHELSWMNNYFKNLIKMFIFIKNNFIYLIFVIILIFYRMKYFEY